MEILEQILKNHHLRITQVRLEILQYFQDNKNALSHADLETHFDKKFDRVTIYRTLTSFLEKGLLHKIPDDSGTAKYGLCLHQGVTHTHDDEHVHFKCSNCGQTTCLDEVELPAFSLPKGYKVAESNLLLLGTCPECN